MLILTYHLLYYNGYFNSCFPNFHCFSSIYLLLLLCMKKILFNLNAGGPSSIFCSYFRTNTFMLKIALVKINFLVMFLYSVTLAIICSRSPFHIPPLSFFIDGLSSSLFRYLQTYDW